jgi:uncharacterized membrane protein YccF (DUF307 family)
MSTLGNIFFFVCGGFVIFLGYVLGGILLCLTIVGIPLASQHLKLMPLTLLPFGRQIVDIDSGRTCP